LKGIFWIFGDDLIILTLIIVVEAMSKGVKASQIIPLFV